MIRQQRGVALLESLIAIVLLSIGVIGTMGLQARTVVAMSEAAMRSEATIAAERLIAQMHNDQGNLASYVTDGVGAIPAALVPWMTQTRKFIPTANVAVTVTGPAPGVVSSNREVGITLSWQRRGAGTSTSTNNSHRVSAHIASSQ